MRPGESWALLITFGVLIYALLRSTIGRPGK